MKNKAHWILAGVTFCTLLVYAHYLPRVEAQNVTTNVPYSCTVTLSSLTTTQCQPVPGTGLRLYVQSYQLFFSVAGTTTTVGLNDGTGTNCASATAALTPTYPNTTVTPVGNAGVFVNFGGAGLVVPFNSAVCVVQAGTTTGTVVATVNGYIGQ